MAAAEQLSVRVSTDDDRSHVQQRLAFTTRRARIGLRPPPRSWSEHRSARSPGPSKPTPPTARCLRNRRYGSVDAGRAVCFGELQYGAGALVVLDECDHLVGNVLRAQHAV